MAYLPLFLDTASGVVMLVGSGPAAQSKLRLLRAAGANIRWLPGQLDAAEEIVRDADGPGRLEVDAIDSKFADLSGVIAVISAGGGAIDTDIAARARAHGIPVNVVDRPDLSTFIFPAVVDRGEVVVAIGTGGTAPVLARRIRRQIDAMLPARIGDLAVLIGRYRKRFAEARRALSPRAFWERVIDGPIATLVLAGRKAEAEARLLIEMERGVSSPDEAAGTVFLVGAGPGDADLLTLRTLLTLADADIIFYDDLVTADVLDRARRDAERVFVGKRHGRKSLSQDEINRRLAEAAKTGCRVVRLKGGDPFIFGRGGEELEYLRSLDIPVVIVPGITAALGCAAEAGLPLTFRNEATQVLLITAHRTDLAEAVDWSGCADPTTTVVVYMGLNSAQAVRSGLIAAGRDRRTPAAALARGTWQESQTAVGRLEELPALAAAVGEGPALIVIGDVVARSTAWRVEADAASVAPDVCQRDKVSDAAHLVL